MPINWTSNETEAQRITQDLGGHWSARRGEAPCPICQPERRKDRQSALTRHQAFLDSLSPQIGTF